MARSANPELPSVFRYFPPAVAKTYVVTFRSHNDDRPSKFIVVAANRKQAINMAWEHGGPDFQVRFDKSTGQAHVHLRDSSQCSGNGFSAFSIVRIQT